MTDTMRAEIAKQAYLLWLQDGGTHGRAEQHWVAAERLLARSDVKSDATLETKALPKKAAPRKPRAKKTLDS